MKTEVTNPRVYSTEESDPEMASTYDGLTSVNMLTKADREWQAEVTQTIADLKTLQQCEEFLAKLESATTDGDVDLFDRGLAIKSWLQGAVLTRIKPLPKKDEHGKPVYRSRIPLPMHNGKRMTLAQYVQDRLPFSVSTAHWVRKVFDVFTLEDIRVLGYREMISQLAPSFRKALADGPPNTPNDADASRTQRPSRCVEKQASQSWLACAPASERPSTALLSCKHSSTSSSSVFMMPMR